MQTPPWKKKRPPGKPKRKLTAAQIAEARELARKAGRRYPNLIDNLRVARKPRPGA